MRQTLLATLLACACAPAAWGDSLTNARSALEARQYDLALARYAEVLSTSPRDADLLIEAGRAAAWADRHALSIAYYLRALSAAPERERDIVPSMAWQYLWHRQPEQSAPLFERALGWQPQDRELRHGLAESRMALGYYTEALPLYRQLLDEQPGELRAQLGHAAALMRLGHHAEAEQAYAAILQVQPDDREANWGLAGTLLREDRPLAAASTYRHAHALMPGDAMLRQEYGQALEWAGLPERALSVLDTADPRAAALRRERDVQSTLEYEFSNDSDDVLVQGWRARLDMPVEALGALSFSFRVASVEDDTRRPLAASWWDGRYGDESQLSTRDANHYLDRAGRYERRPGVREFMATYSHLLTDERSPWGVVRGSLSLGERAVENWTQTAWRAHLNWMPKDRWWVDVDAGNSLVETPQALANRIDVTAYSVSVTHRFNEHWLGSLSLAQVHFDAGRTAYVTQEQTNGYAVAGDTAVSEELDTAPVGSVLDYTVPEGLRAVGGLPFARQVCEDANQNYGAFCRARLLGVGEFDSNRRERLSGWVERKVYSDPDVVVGANLLWFQDSSPSSSQSTRVAVDEDAIEALTGSPGTQAENSRNTVSLDRGYYSPERYRENSLYVAVSKSTALGDVRLRLGLGELREYPGNGGESSRATLRTGEVSWRRDLNEDHRLSAYAGFSDSLAGSSSGGDGYERVYAGVAWNWRF